MDSSSSGGNLPPGAPKPGELYIPPTTKVLDSDSRDALQSFGKEGDLVFSHSNDLLASLVVDDVVVSEPAAAAPSGLLRKVVSIQTQGDQLIVTTSEAQLWDAIPQGKIDFTRHLDSKDIILGQSLPSSVVSAESLTIPINTDFGSNGIITMTGNVTIDPTITLNIDTFCSNWVEILIWNIFTFQWEHWYWSCDSHGIEVTSSLELNEQANLTISGTASYTYQNEVPIATYSYSPIIIWMGYVPVVFIPKIVIYLGVDGSVSASLSVSATQTLDLIAGFHYKTGDGFQNLSQTNGTFSVQNPTYQAQVDIFAYAGAKFEVFLYGLLGPYGALEAGPEFTASMTGIIEEIPAPAAAAATSQTGVLLWKLDGCIRLKAGIDSIPILGIQYDNVLYEGCTTFASYENEPPTVSITAPTGGLKTNSSVSLTGSLVDPEGGPVSCSWGSSKLLDNFVAPHVMSTNCNDSVVLSLDGQRTLTLIGTDQAGASSSASVSINIQSGPLGPKIGICCPQKETGFFDVDQPLTLSSLVDSGAPRNRYEWTFDCCDNSRIKVGQTIGTENPMQWTPGSIKEFAGLCGVIGTGKITLIETDPKGATQEATAEITLVRTTCGK